MSDDLDLDELKTLMQAATPAPDAVRKAENLALAQENFDRLQGSADDARFTSEAPDRGRFRGVFDMLRTFPAKAALTASTAIVAVGLAIYLPVSDLPSKAPKLAGTGTDEEKAVQLADPVVEPAVIQEFSAANRAPVADKAIAAPAPTRMAKGLVTAEPELRTPMVEADTEAYPEVDRNPVRVTAENPVSTFSVDVDTASYAILRNSLQRGHLPPKDAVRIEEMVNYFPYDYPAPEPGRHPFSVAATTLQTPWNSDTRLVHIGLQGQMPALEDRPALNLVFLIDTSGSMDAPNKLPLLKQSFSLMLAQLRPEDQVAIVTYAGSSGLELEPTAAGDRATILSALDKLGAGGATAGQAGLQQAYATAESMMQDGAISRVILATDGDFNVGLSDPQALSDFIADKRDSGTYLSVLGFGRGNLDDATMQALAQNGNGQAAYIDTLNEAQKVLVDQLTGALFPIADDVKIQVEFNPAQVAEYRLIGYETRNLAREDFNNDKVDAGEIGAGHAVTALYEITPVGSPARLTDPLRYAGATTDNGSDETGFVKLRYKAPGADISTLIEIPIAQGRTTSDDMRFAAAIAGFGQLLSDDRYLGNWAWQEAIDLANGARGHDPYGYRTEAVQLMRLAQSLAARD